MVHSRILGQAADDAKDCIELIENLVDHSTKAPLLCKNLWRLARALHYNNNKNDTDVVELLSVLRHLVDLADPSFSPKASKLLDQLSYYSNSTHRKKWAPKDLPLPPYDLAIKTHIASISVLVMTTRYPCSKQATVKPTTSMHNPYVCKR